MQVSNRKRKNLLKLKIKHIGLVAFLMSVILLTTACSGRPKGVLSKSEMTDFLVEMHKLDGALAVKGLGSVQERQNIYYYNSLLKKYGITQAEFDSSLSWYAKNPKMFEKIYARVMDELTLQDSIQKVQNKEYEKMLAYKVNEYSLWNGRNSMLINQDSTNSGGYPFVVKFQNLAEKDLYTLSFRLRSSGNVKNQSIVMRIHYQNGLKDSVFTKIKSDSILRKYTLNFRVSRQEKIDSITGVIAKTTTKNTRFKTTIDSISLMRKYIPAVQDSLIKVAEMKAMANQQAVLSGNAQQPTPRMQVLRYKKAKAINEFAPPPAFR